MSARLGPATAAVVPAVVALLLAGCVGEAAPAARGPGSADTVPAPPIAGGIAPLEPVRAYTGEAPGRLGFGRPVGPSEIARAEIDVLPDGTGLPPGRGTVDEGARVYRARCAACHGATGTDGPFARLVSPPGERAFPSSRRRTGPTTIGNYWPHATALFEYVSRAMPMQEPGSLEAGEVYAVVAWLLHRNGIVAGDAVMDRETIPAVKMPGAGRFVVDDRTGGPEVR